MRHEKTKHQSLRQTQAGSLPRSPSPVGGKCKMARSRPSAGSSPRCGELPQRELRRFLSVTRLMWLGSSLGGGSGIGQERAGLGQRRAPTLGPTRTLDCTPVFGLTYDKPLLLKLRPESVCWVDVFKQNRTESHWEILNVWKRAGVESREVIKDRLAERRRTRYAVVLVCIPKAVHAPRILRVDAFIGFDETHHTELATHCRGVRLRGREPRGFDDLCERLIGETWRRKRNRTAWDGSDRR